MKQIGLRRIGIVILNVCIDYFSKWIEVKPIKDKSTLTAAQFLYVLICRHGCFQIQINAVSSMDGCMNWQELSNASPLSSTIKWIGGKTGQGS